LLNSNSVQEAAVEGEKEVQSQKFKAHYTNNYSDIYCCCRVYIYWVPTTYLVPTSL